MAGMLTSRDLQEMLHVDRSTIYRMAEAGTLPAVKVGRQWRFPTEAIERWLTTGDRRPTPAPEPGSNELIPAGCVQPVLDVLAEMLGIMLVVTDMDGIPVTDVSNPCGLFTAVAELPGGTAACIAGWHELAGSLNLEPQFTPSHLGLLCARAFVRVGSELVGMVVAGGITPDSWPPDEATLEEIAADFGVEPSALERHIHEVYRLEDRERKEILEVLPSIGYMISEITSRHLELRQKLEAIASLATNKEYR
jgi:excisionase family DNA binding protein